MNGINDFRSKTNLKFMNLDDCSGDVCGGCEHGIKWEDVPVKLDTRNKENKS